MNAMHNEEAKMSQGKHSEQSPQGKGNYSEETKTQFIIILGRETFFLSLFKTHAFNVKPELTYMYWVAYFSSKISILKDQFFYTQFKALLSDYSLGWDCWDDM